MKSDTAYKQALLKTKTYGKSGSGSSGGKKNTSSTTLTKKQTKNVNRHIKSINEVYNKARHSRDGVQYKNVVDNYVKAAQKEGSMSRKEAAAIYAKLLK